jgi:hypothetical protein
VKSFGSSSGRRKTPSSADSFHVFERSALRKKSEREVRRSVERVKLHSPMSGLPTRTVTVLLTLGMELEGRFGRDGVGLPRRFGT